MLKVPAQLQNSVKMFDPSVLQEPKACPKQSAGEAMTQASTLRASKYPGSSNVFLPVTHASVYL
jgi:hypothetical protein